MIYEFTCDECELTIGFVCAAFKPVEKANCPECGFEMRRVYGARIDTTGCKDHDFIPHDKRVYDDVQTMSGEKKGRIFTKHVNERRKLLREGNRGDIRQTHSVPSDLFHGKIRETGDKDYWSDPANMKRHESCRVDK